MNFEPYDNANDDVVAPSLGTIMEIVERRQRRRYQAAGVGVMAGLAAAGAVMTDVFQRGGATLESVETAGETADPNLTSQPPLDAASEDATDDTVEQTTVPAEADGVQTTQTAVLTTTVSQQESDESGESDPAPGDDSGGQTPTTADPTDDTNATSTTNTTADTTTTILTTTAPDDETTSTTPPEAILCPAPSGAMDDGAWIGRGLIRFDEAAISEADAETLADAWGIPAMETQALLGLGADSGVNLMNDLGAIQIWDNWAADYQFGETLGIVADAWNSTSISVKALYLIGEPSAVAAVSDCPPA